jgi:hypothetical protein
VVEETNLPKLPIYKELDKKATFRLRSTDFRNDCYIHVIQSSNDTLRRFLEINLDDYSQ